MTYPSDPNYDGPENAADIVLTEEEELEGDIAAVEANWFTTERKFSLALLVRTAVALRPQAQSDSHAADEALRLIDTCARLNEKNAQKRREAQEIAKGRASLGLKKGEKISYAKAIKLITRQERHSRAEEDYLAYLEAKLRYQFSGHYHEDAYWKEMHDQFAAGVDGKEWFRAEIAGKLANRGKNGFGFGGMDEARRDFWQLRNAGHLGKKRAPTKNNLEPNPIPKIASKVKKLARRTSRPAK